MKGLIDEYFTLSKQESQAKHDKELIKPLLIEYMEQHDMLKLFGNVYQVSASKNENISIEDKEHMKKILGEL